MNDRSHLQQKRNYYRVAESLRVTVRLPDVDPDVWHVASTLDVSGGGVSIPWNGEVAPGTRMDVQIAIPKQPPFRAAATVVVSRLAPTARATHRLGLEFGRIPDSERTRLVRVVLEAQRKRRC